MVYAKKCNKCDVQVIWDDKIIPPQGSNNKFKEVNTGLPHAARCQGNQQQGQNYNPQQQKEFVESYVPVSTKSPAFDHQPQQKQDNTIWISEKIDVIEGQYQRLNTKIDNLGMAVAQIEGIISNHLENNPKEKEVMMLRQKVTELEEVIKRQGKSFVPANQMQRESAELDDEHVASMVQKGKNEEELEP